ncbi:peptidyl-prolyl cis-trans isomerase [Streptococcus fryi]
MKKRFWATGLITLMSVATLAACSANGSEGNKIVTMKGDTITVSDFYEQVKTTQAAKQAVLTLVLNKVLEEQYGDKVSKDDVADAYNKMAEQYGESFDRILESQGMTKEAYKQQIRTEKLLESAVTEAAKAELNDETYKATFDSYQPEMTAQVIMTDSEDDAKAILEKAKAEGTDFAALAKEKSKSEKTEYTFDSSSSDLPADVKTAAFGLAKDGLSEVVTVLDVKNYTNSYYIVKATKKTEKGNDWKAYKKELESAYLNQKKSDPTFINSVVSKALEKANVKVVDNAFSSILAQYASVDDAKTDDSKAEGK